VHRNNTLRRACRTGISDLSDLDKMIFRLGAELAGGLPIQGVEALFTASLLVHQPGLLQRADVVGDLGLAHPA
jgi:hypothetical protein